jgi:plastocyanin
MKKSKKIFILLTLVLIMSATALSGCAAGIGNGRIANQSNNTLSRKIIKGKTTESQIKQMFGDPDKTTFNSKDDLMWTYEYQHDHDTVAAYIPVVNWFAKDVKGHKKMLVILFNKKGIVKNYAFSNSSNSMSLGM